MQQSAVNLSRDQAINLLESATGMTFSTEQLAILRQPYQQPTLINACAGSGKTTIFMLSALVAIMTGKISPENVLGITFSKKAQTDMENRYRQCLMQLKAVGIDLAAEGMPYFSTFHALFYRLLRTTPEFRETKVLTSYRQFSLPLTRLIKHTHSQVNSPSEILDNMFELAEFIINRGISHNAFADLSDPKQLKAQLGEVGEDEYDLDFYTDYLAVMTQYMILKRQNSFVDFNDMKILLRQLLDQPDHVRSFHQIMTRFKLVVMDEFQDIDNLQWDIMTRLLSQEALSRLIVIGDDDQSIYSFRGSNPKFILKFHGILPGAKTYRLSTNYRTGGQILSEAKPLIKHNYVRLAKELKAFNEKKGQVHVYPLKTAGFDPNSDMFTKLVSQIRDPEIDNHQIAVLVRYNSDRTLVADWLANQQIYVNINNRGAIFQHTLIYRILVNLMQAFWQNRFQPFHEQATRIGFTTYRRHVTEIDKAAGGIDSLSDYLEIATKYNLQHQRTENQKRFAKIDTRVRMAFKIIKEQRQDVEKANSETSIGDVFMQIWNTVLELTATYFDYMTKNDFVSKDTFKDMTTYLHTEIKQITDPDVWFDQEDQKRQLLEANIQKGVSLENDVQFLSLHQAKGLEFKYVYLYGLSDKQLPVGTTIINDWFHPDISFEDFIDRWNDLVTRQRVKELTGILEAAFIDITEEVRKNKHIDLNHIEIEKCHDLDLDLLHNWYTAIRHYSQFIEEERRLIYVGMTRTKTVLNVSVGLNASPLLRQVPIVSKVMQAEKEKKCKAKSDDHK
ncbi:UvrD-helicase domain-containing protein [Lentilactobacillus hilgardii]|uniref:UvrD-helicase domain-containing protein n=1 Tax=Lentilactobacillus hilgardii TaxID=1588 RepID=UPI003FA5C0AA